MYNLNKNKYLLYIISYIMPNGEAISFYYSLVKALQHIIPNISNSNYKFTNNRNVDDYQIINEFIIKLKENDKKPLSITKYNYNYYLNDCDEEKEQMLFNKIFILIIIAYNNLREKQNITNILVLWQLLIENIKMQKIC